MSDCSNCCKCFLQADGSIVKRADRTGTASGFVFTLTDGTMSETVPATFVSTTEVSCAKFDQAANPPNTIAVLEEVDVDGKQTGVLVQVIENADGSKTYQNLSDNSPYVAPAGSTLHTSEDTDYNERTIVLCDEGVDVVTTVIFKDGDITDIVSTTVTKLDGSVHTLSGNERSGSCSNLVKTDQESACFLEVDATGASVPDQPKRSGYVQYTTDGGVTPSVTTSVYFDDSDTLLAKAATGVAGFKRVQCC